MKRIILGGILLLFSLLLFSSYVIVKNKVKKDEPTFVIKETNDIKDSEAQKMVERYDPTKQYYWKYTIRKTYHSKGLKIYTTQDTLSRELKLENK